MVASALAPRIKNIDKLLAHCQRRRHAAKSNLISAGDTADSLSFIIKGSVTILIEDDDGHEMIIAYLNAGDFFGELGLFGPEEQACQRSAWVRSKTDCEIAEISYEKFRELADEDPQILYALGTQMAQRLRNTTRRLLPRDGRTCPQGSRGAQPGPGQGQDHGRAGRALTPPDHSLGKAWSTSWYTRTKSRAQGASGTTSLRAIWLSTWHRCAKAQQVLKRFTA